MRDATVNPQSGAFCGTPAAARRQGNGWARWNLSLPRPLSFCLALRAAVLACVAATLASCSSDSGRFRIEGRFRNLNRGEFYVYSPDGGIQGRDTIPVVDGRFAYEATITDRATFVLIFGMILLAATNNTLVCWIGVGLIAVSALFSIVTLPVEYNASARALAWLESSGTMQGSQLAQAREALMWAARTYLVAALSAIASVLYYAMLILGRGNNRD